MVSWDYFDRFNELSDKYLPDRGEGENMATQIVTAVSKLVYKFYNDGDVFDNTYMLEGWWNDLSSYANWLDRYTNVGNVLEQIKSCYNNDDYSYLLKILADRLMDADYLADMEKLEKQGTIYKCDGKYKFEEYEEEDDEELDDEDWDW